MQVIDTKQFPWNLGPEKVQIGQFLSYSNIIKANIGRKALEFCAWICTWFLLTDLILVQPAW